MDTYSVYSYQQPYSGVAVGDIVVTCGGCIVFSLILEEFIVDLITVLIECTTEDKTYQPLRSYSA